MTSATAPMTARPLGAEDGARVQDLVLARREGFHEADVVDDVLDGAELLDPHLGRHDHVGLRDDLLRELVLGPHVPGAGALAVLAALVVGPAFRLHEEARRLLDAQQLVALVVGVGV